MKNIMRHERLRISLYFEATIYISEQTLLVMIDSSSENHERIMRTRKWTALSASNHFFDGLP